MRINTKVLKKLPLEDPSDFEHLYEILEMERSELENRLRPGAISSSGFMGMKERYEYIIRDDMRTLEQIGLTHQQFSRLIREVLDGRIGEDVERFSRSIRSFLSFSHRNYRYKITKRTNSGFQACPFTLSRPEGCSYDYEIFRYPEGGVSSIISKIKKLLSGPDRIIIGGSLPYYIENYGFFEGKESEFRLDPRDFLSYFNITSEDIERLFPQPPSEEDEE